MIQPALAKGVWGGVQHNKIHKVEQMNSNMEATT